jgi:hypothetical protein
MRWFKCRSLPEELVSLAAKGWAVAGVGKRNRPAIEIFLARVCFLKPEKQIWQDG